MLKSSVVFLILSFLFISACSDNAINETAPGSINGLVVNAKDQAPVKGVSITTDPVTISILSDAEGKFEIKDIPEGEYSIIASKLNFVTNTVKVKVNSGKSTSTVIVLNDTLGQSFGSIDGTILSAVTNLPVAGVSISTDPASTTVVTDTNGKFLLQYLIPGDYNINAKKSDYQSISQSVKVFAGKTITVVIKMTDNKSANKPPDKPLLLEPYQNEIVVDSNITLEWSCTDPDGDALKYDVMLSENNPPDKFIAKNITANQLMYILPKDSAEYYWKIIAKDKYDDFSESDVYRFEYIKGHVPTGGMILHYTFDNKDASDNTEYSNDGILKNNPKFIPGKLGYCARLVGSDKFDSSGSYIELPFINFKQYPAFTIALWVYEEQSHQGTGEAYINWGISSNGWIGISNYLNPANNNILTINFSCGAILDGWEKVPLWVPFDTYSRNKWVHYALVFQEGFVYGYINGKNIGKKAQVIGNIDNYAAIGKHWWNFNGFHNSTDMDFRVDEVRVYNRALSDNEIKALAH